MSEPPPPPPGTYPGGYPPQPYGGYPPPVPVAPKNGLGTASLVVAIISLFTLFGGVVLGIVAVVLGSVIAAALDDAFDNAEVEEAVALFAAIDRARAARLSA